MTVREFLQSGIIDSYCLGFTSQEEDALVCEMAAQHKEVAEEIDSVRKNFANVLHSRKMNPSPGVKTAVMRSIYAQQALEKKEWVPLMDEVKSIDRYQAAAIANAISYETAPQDFKHIYVKELPSTNEVLNFAVWAREGHEEETHEDRNEFIAVLEGSCDMFMDGKKQQYQKGDIIVIPPHLPHHAIVTSPQPMFALVQRQLLPNS